MLFLEFLLASNNNNDVENLKEKTEHREISKEGNRENPKVEYNTCSQTKSACSPPHKPQ
jgi:hypothetical protein